MQNQNTETKEFTTKDLLLASVLVTLGFPYSGPTISYEGSRGRAVGFWIFKEDENLALARRQYNSGLLRVEPRALWSSLSGLKSEVASVVESSSPTTI